MDLKVFPTSDALADAAADHAARCIRDAIAARGVARIIAATGASQMAFLGRLVSLPEIDWPRVEMFHLDEYIGLPADHPASFRKYLLERLIRPAGITRHHFLDGEQDPNLVRLEVGAQIRSAPVDVAFVGIGENGHLAFNDPPARFDTEESVHVVRLDMHCRAQQVGEGHFASLADTPESALSLTVPALLRPAKVLVLVPEKRKAAAVRAALEGPVTEDCPASILTTVGHATLYLDADSAGELSEIGTSRP